MDILVFGLSLDNGECGFGGHDGVINKGGCLFVFQEIFVIGHALQRAHLLPSTKQMVCAYLSIFCKVLSTHHASNIQGA